MQDEQAKNAFISVVGICSIYLTLTLGTAIFQQLDHFLSVTFDIPSIFSTYAIFLILVFSINKRGGVGDFLDWTSSYRCGPHSGGGEGQTANPKGRQQF